MPEPAHGWRLLQLAELLRAIEGYEHAALRALRGVDRRLPTGSTVTIARSDVDEVRAIVSELTQLAERAEQLAEALGGEDDVDVDHDAVATAAAHELAEGILDPDHMRLAANLLRRQDGWPALAEGLQTTDVHSAWEGITVADLLGAFREIPPQLARGVAAAAGLAPGAEIAACEPDEIARLAARLDEHPAEP